MRGPLYDTVIAHYNEIVLKLGHRPMFVGRLVENTRSALDGVPVEGVRSEAARLVVGLGTVEAPTVIERLRHVPGIANLLPAARCACSLDAVSATLEQWLGEWRPAGTFRVIAKRADKRFPLKSPEIARHLGAIVARASGARVDLGAADSTVSVFVTGDAIYLSVADKTEGAGGLPVSTGGRVLLLLSGGIDSPVAGIRMMRRGCRVDAVHFHSVPYLDGSSRDKARQLCAVLARGQGGVRLSMVAFGEIQSEIVRRVPRPLRVVLYRRMMVRIASRLAKHDGAAALVTGDSLGQVASQTLANLTVTERASELPMLRPLIGMDKLEITRYAEQVGTYEISILPDQDCCSLFVPKHPSTGATLREVEEAEDGLPIETWIEQAVAAREREIVAPVWHDEPLPGATSFVPYSNR